MWQFFYVHPSLYRILVSGKSFLLMGMFFRRGSGNPVSSQKEDGKKGKAH
jgi:hypothetical protein